MKLILTSTGFEHDRIGRKFVQLLPCNANKAKVLFVPTAAIDDIAKECADKSYRELLRFGIVENNIYYYDCDRPIDDAELANYDVIYICGGDTMHLLARVRESGFDEAIKRALDKGKIYVGASAGSSLVCKGYLGILNIKMNVHCNKGVMRHINKWWITDKQAVICDDGKPYVYE